MSILISFFFGVLLFGVTLLVCLKTFRPAARASAEQKAVAFRAEQVARMTVAAPAPKLEGNIGGFLPIQATWELRFPKVALHGAIRPVYLPLGAPLAPPMPAFSAKQLLELPIAPEPQRNIA